MQAGELAPYELGRPARQPSGLARSVHGDHLSVQVVAVEVPGPDRSAFAPVWSPPAAGLVDPVAAGPSATWRR
jgi:hypothetical protein